MVQVTIAVLGLASSLVAGPRWLVCLDLAPVHHLPWALALAAAILSCVDLVTVMTFPLAVQVSIAQWAVQIDQIQLSVVRTLLICLCLYLEFLNDQ